MNAPSQELPIPRSAAGSETSCQSSPSWQKASASLKSSELARGRGVCNCSGSKRRQTACRVPPCTSTVGKFLTAAAAEPLPEGTLEVTFTQSDIFPGLQILKSGCNRAICSWTENLSGDWLGEGRKEGERLIPGAGRRGCHVLEKQLNCFLFTNLCFGTSDKLAGKLLTPLYPGSALCQLLPSRPVRLS